MDRKVTLSALARKFDHVSALSYGACCQGQGETRGADQAEEIGPVGDEPGVWCRGRTADPPGLSLQCSERSVHCHLVQLVPLCDNGSRLRQRDPTRLVYRHLRIAGYTTSLAKATLDRATLPIAAASVGEGLENFVKFCPPSVADGLLSVATFGFDKKRQQ